MHMRRTLLFHVLFGCLISEIPFVPKFKGLKVNC